MSSFAKNEPELVFRRFRRNTLVSKDMQLICEAGNLGSFRRNARFRRQYYPRSFSRLYPDSQVGATRPIHFLPTLLGKHGGTISPSESDIKSLKSPPFVSTPQQWEGPIVVMLRSDLEIVSSATTRFPPLATLFRIYRSTKYG